MPMVLFMRKLTKHENTLKSLPFVSVQYEKGGQRLLGVQSINTEGALFFNTMFKNNVV